MRAGVAHAPLERQAAALAREQAWHAAEERKQAALAQQDIAIAAARTDALAGCLPRVHAALSTAVSMPADYSPAGIKVADGEADGIRRVRVFRNLETENLSAMLGQGPTARILAAIKSDSAGGGISCGELVQAKTREQTS